MKAAIMQPYFLPYIGYWQLIGAVDVFVVYDNIKYTKKGWINRNRFLQNGNEAVFSLPLKKDSDFLDVKDRCLAPSFNRDELINRFREAYRKAPGFPLVMPLLEEVVRCPDDNLFAYIWHSIGKVCAFLGIPTKLIVSSTLPIDHTLKGAAKVQAICGCLDAETYINPIGGVSLYDREEFASHGIELKFLESKEVRYEQDGHTFVPWLSVADVLMFTSKEEARAILSRGYAIQ
jgi:hypothetical protein